MARILALSSYVIGEAVGLQATRFALERTGHEVWALPMVTLSNHPGRAHCWKRAHDPSDVADLLDGLEANGFLKDIDALLTGYLPSPDHVDAATEALLRVRAANPGLVYLCDPILGEVDGGLYIDEAAATSLRDRLLPEADIVTPNVFELAWLTGKTLGTFTDAQEAMAALSAKVVVTTSFPVGAEQLANIMKSGVQYFDVRVSELAEVPHGTGDFLAGLFLSAVLDGRPVTDALRFAVNGTRIALEGLQEQDRFEVVSTQEHWARVSGQ